MLRQTIPITVMTMTIVLGLMISLITDTVSGAKVGTNGKSTGQRFAMEPQDQTAIVGSRVTLPCRVIDKMGMLQWTKDDFGLGTHRNLSGFDRYSMVGSDEEGDFSLDIYPVMLDDDAKYQCQVGPGPEGQPGIRSRFAGLTVLVPPDPPKIVQGDFMVTTEDREIELECISVGGKPAAEITWIDGLGNVLTNGIDYVKELLGDSRRYTAKSILKLTPKKEHHNTTFTCQAQNTADRTYRSAKLKLEVKYAPKVSVSVIGGALAGGRIPEGAEVRLSCHADANPSELTYRWYVNDELQIGDYTTEMLIHNITRKYHDKIVKCEVHNAVGKSEESETLDISYGPIFRQKPRSVEADSDATVSLTCDVDGNPTPDIIWIHDKTGKVVGTSTNLTVTVNEDTSGRYYCKASVISFPEIGAEASIFLKGPPVITSPQRQHGIVGDNARIECIAFSVPKARHVSWTFNGREINISHDHNYSILEDPLPEGIKSTLIIRESQSRHFGRYNCTVVNEYGNYVMEIDLIPQTIAPSLIIIVCVGLSVAITILVVIFLCIFLKRGKKKLPPADVIPDHHISEKQMAAGCKDSDRSSNISDLKADIRANSCEPDYSETGSDSIANRLAANVLGSTYTSHNIMGGMPLAGPVKIPNDYRYSGEYTNSLDHFQHLKAGQHNNGYVPYVDYARDYSPPPHLAHVQQQNLRNAMQNTSSAMNLNHNNNTISTSSNSSSSASTTTAISQLYHNNNNTNNNINSSNNSNNNNGTYSLNRNINRNITQDNGLPSIQNNLNTLQQNGYLSSQQLLQSGLNIDPRYSAVYGNPYLRTSSNTSLPPLPPPSTANPAATPAPPPYNSATRQNHNTSSGQNPPTSSTTPQQLMHMNSLSSNSSSNLLLGSSNVNNSSATSMTTQLITSPSSGQFILPANGDLKKTGALATHV